MKKLICVLALAAAIYMFSEENKTVAANVGFDDLSRSIEVSISRNPVAAMVFGMDSGQAVEVFGHSGERG